MHARESNQKLKLQKQKHSVWILLKQRCCVRVGAGGGRDESIRDEGVETSCVCSKDCKTT